MKFILIILLGLTITPRESIFETVDYTVVEELKFQTNIQIQNDSSIAMAMLLNRECPTCSYDEKIYWASCIVTGSQSVNVSWKHYIFKMKQFWRFNDKRIQFNPSIPNHIENLMACKQAWANPHKVRFYAGKYDIGTKHYKQVKNNAVWKGHHYYSYKLRT